MGGRPSKPTALIIAEGKSHRTKAELTVRETAEKSLYTGEPFREQQQVKDNAIAHAEFLRLKKLYKKISYVDALDQNIINRYCLEFAAIYDFQSHIERLKADLEMIENTAERIQLYEMIGKTYDRMNRSKAMLLKYEDRLLLTPTGRMRAIPKTPPPDESEDSGFAAFFNKRAEAQ
jgi:phage terminase small subunit